MRRWTTTNTKNIYENSSWPRNCLQLQAHMLNCFSGTLQQSFICARSPATHTVDCTTARDENLKKKWKFYNLSIRHQFSLINHVRYVCVLCQYTFFFFATRCTWSRLFRIYIYIYTAVFVQCGVCLLIYFIVSQVITVMAA